MPWQDQSLMISYMQPLEGSKDVPAIFKLPALSMSRF